MSNYNHQLFEASERESKEMIKEFGITSFPTQIRITKAKDTLLLEGYVKVEQQLRFLEGKTNTGKAVKELSNTAGEINKKVAGQGFELSEIGKKFICIFVKNESFEDFMAKAEKMVKREVLNSKIFKNISQMYPTTLFVKIKKQ